MRYVDIIDFRKQILVNLNEQIDQKVERRMRA
jgi:hypothetical protein